MKLITAANKKIFTLPLLLQQVAAWRALGKSIAFTNGCFDILHIGHIHSFNQSAKEADILVVGINSDASVKRLGKSPERPINNQENRALLLANFITIDAVIIFDEDTPLELIKAIMPNVLVKGGDYTINTIVGAKEVMASGGRVVINSLVEGYSTTNILSKLKA
jgi:D-beta-D-heptose 7-phosphate kinase/D-beta-D-heptose 1-phosphate adenosyltransferase